MLRIGLSFDTSPPAGCCRGPSGPDSELAELTRLVGAANDSGYRENRSIPKRTRSSAVSCDRRSWRDFRHAQDYVATPRTKSIGTKVTEAEYDAIVDRAHPRTVSEWTREVVLDAVYPDALHFLMLAEVVALRTILLNLNFALSRREPISADVMQGLIDRADAEKFDKAKERLARLQTAVQSTRR